MNSGPAQGTPRRSAACVIASLLLVVLSQRAFAEATGDPRPSPSRPLSVPGNFVVTPMGYFHPSCVVSLAAGEKLVGDLVQHRDGSQRAIIPCNYPRYDAKGYATYPLSSASPPPQANNYQAFATLSQAPMAFLSAEWTVPDDPPHSLADQTVYLFPGFQDSPSSRILQPVLAWNGNSGGGKKWVVYSWNCCVAGNPVQSPPVDASSGARVRGTMQGTNCNATTGVCPNWSITTETEQGPGQWVGSTLDTTVSTAMVQALGGALEVYAVDTCRQLPGGPGTTFSSLTLQFVGGAPVPAAWTNTENPNSPDCVLNVTSNPSTVTVQYTSNDPLWCSAGRKCCDPGIETCHICVPSGAQCP
jgi:hypothetical protein